MLGQMSYRTNNTEKSGGGAGPAVNYDGDTVTTSSPVDGPHRQTPEIVAAAAYIASLLLPRDVTAAAAAAAAELEAQLCFVLAARYRSHWFVDNADRGSGYRSLLFGPNHVDPAVRSAVTAAGVSLAGAGAAVAAETTVWVDPGMVVSRSGGSGMLCSIYGGAPTLGGGARDRSQSPSLRLSPKANAFTPSRTRSQSPPLRRSRKPLLINPPGPLPAPRSRAPAHATTTATNMAMAMSPPPGLMSPPPGLAIPAFLFHGLQA